MRLYIWISDQGAFRIVAINLRGWILVVGLIPKFFYHTVAAAAGVKGIWEATKDALPSLKKK